MKIFDGLKVGVAILCFATLSVGEASRFSGVWQTKKSPVIGKPAVTVLIEERGKTVDGRIILVNPNRSQIEMPILNPRFDGKDLTFQTRNGESSFDWRMTPKGKRMLLNGSFEAGEVGAMLTKQQPRRAHSQKSEK